MNIEWLTYQTSNLSPATLTYTNPSDVSVGQKAPFDLILSGVSIPIPEIANYSLQVNFEPSKNIIGLN